MIVAEVGERYELVTQGDHAYLAADLLSLFKIPTLVEHPRRDLLIRATREHDRGWRGADAAPQSSPESGRPIGFREIGDAWRREIWSSACAEGKPGEEPYSRLLIVLHALYLHRDRSAMGDWEDWLAELRASRSELLEECGLDRAEAESDHAWLALADLCSLALCERRRHTFTWAGYEGMSDGSVLRLAPFPMAGTTTFSYPCRHLERRRFASDRELGRSLATARWTRRSVSVGPLER